MLDNTSEMVKITAGVVAQALVNEVLKDRAQPKFIHGLPALSKFLNVSVRTAERYKQKGFIPYKKIGGKIFFETAEVLKVMEVNHG